MPFPYTKKKRIGLLLLRHLLQIETCPNRRFYSLPAFSLAIFFQILRRLYSSILPIVVFWSKHGFPDWCKGGDSLFYYPKYRHLHGVPVNCSEHSLLLDASKDSYISHQRKCSFEHTNLRKIYGLSIFERRLHQNLHHQSLPTFLQKWLLFSFNLPYWILGIKSTKTDQIVKVEQFNV